MAEQKDIKDISEELRGFWSTPFYINGVGEIEYKLPENLVDTKTNLKMDIEDNPKLKEVIFESVSRILNALGFVDDQELVLNDLWYNKYDESRPELSFHYHQNCAWTGTYYPHETNHVTSFFNPNAGLVVQHFPKQQEDSEYASQTFHLEPIQGSIVIHPAYIPHTVRWLGGNTSNSISFDVSYKAPVGCKDFGSYKPE